MGGIRGGMLVLGAAVSSIAFAAPSPWRHSRRAGTSPRSAPLPSSSPTSAAPGPNSTGATDDVVLRNQVTGQQITVTAPPGDSFWEVPATEGNNTVQLIVDGVTVSVKASNNNACSVLAGNAVCNPALGVTTVTLTLKNNDTGPASLDDPPGLTFAPNPVPAQGSATASETVPGPTATTTRSLTVTSDLGRGVASQPSASVTVGPCLAPSVDFTFTKTPSVTEAAVGETVTYTYAGTNTGDVPIEVVNLVDDRLGIVIEEPEVTIVDPGGSLSRQVDYVVRSADAGTTVTNNAVVTLRPIVDGQPGASVTGVAAASVVVPELPPPVDPTTTTTTTTTSTAPVTTVFDCSTTTTTAAPTSIEAASATPGETADGAVTIAPPSVVATEPVESTDTGSTVIDSVDDTVTESSVDAVTTTASSPSSDSTELAASISPEGSAPALGFGRPARPGSPLVEQVDPCASSPAAPSS